MKFRSWAASPAWCTRGRKTTQPLAERHDTLEDFFSGLCGHDGNPAILYLQVRETRRWSFAELADTVEQLAASLARRRLGLRLGKPRRDLLARRFAKAERSPEGSDRPAPEETLSGTDRNALEDPVATGVWSRLRKFGA